MKDSSVARGSWPSAWGRLPALLLVPLCAAVATVPSCQSTPPEGFDEVLVLMKGRANQHLEGEKLQQFVALLDEAQGIVDEIHSLEQRKRARLLELNRDYDTPPESFEAELDSLRKSVVAAIVGLAQIRLEARTLVTEEEWRQLNKGVAATSSSLEDA